MQEIIVGNRLIHADILEVLDRVSAQISNGKIAYYHLSGDNVQICCPFHSEGHEHRPSCFINVSNEAIPVGWFNCFTCGSKGSFAKFVGACFDRGQHFGEQWLLENYASDELEEEPLLIKEFKEVDDEVKDDSFLDESILNTFDDYHPYMTQRKLTSDIIKRFQIKYDPLTKSLVFPVRNKQGKLVALTRRSVEGKKFDIQKGFDKKNIYLLSEVIKNDIEEVFVVESQINALTLWSWGMPAVCLFGAGTTEEQIEQLNTTGIIHYILCYDPDPAGEKGANRFKKFIKDDVFVDTVVMPKCKDVNDLSKEEFEKLLEEEMITCNYQC